jgi:hypothetical protein
MSITQVRISETIFFLHFSLLFPKKVTALEVSFMKVSLPVPDPLGLMVVHTNILALAAAGCQAPFCAKLD